MKHELIKAKIMFTLGQMWSVRSGITPDSQSALNTAACLRAAVFILAPVGTIVSLPCTSGLHHGPSGTIQHRSIIRHTR